MFRIIVGLLVGSENEVSIKTNSNGHHHVSAHVTYVPTTTKCSFHKPIAPNIQLRPCMADYDLTGSYGSAFRLLNYRLP